MAHEMIDGTFRQTNLPNESAEYLSKREELRLAEIESMRQRERVAELRRQLPQGATIQDYAFEEGPAKLGDGDTPIRTVRLSELFTRPSVAGRLPLYVRKEQATPCPMCTLGSTAGMVSLITWPRMSMLPLLPRPIRWRCERTRAGEAGTTCGS